jgi:hypothetical protein
MSENFDEILSAALSLSPGARAMLTEHLLDSLNGEDQSALTPCGLMKLRGESGKLTKARLHLYQEMKSWPDCVTAIRGSDFIRFPAIK